MSLHSESMELRQLVYFDAIVRHGGFTRAAEALHVAQPAVSAQLRRLETELGTALLRRTTRSVGLTQAGELFLVRARRVLDELDGAQADLADLSQVLSGRLRIGATQVLGSLDLPAVLARFRRDYPGVALELRAGLIAQLRSALAAGELDLVIGPVDRDLDKRFVTRRLGEERLVLVSPPDRRISARSLADVRDEPFVCLPAGSGLHSILIEAAAAAGYLPRIEFETHGPGSIRELVSAGLGVALLAESAARAAGPRVDMHELHPAPAHPPIGLIRRRERSQLPAARAFGQALADDRELAHSRGDQSSR